MTTVHTTPPSPAIHSAYDEIDDEPSISLMEILTWIGEGKRIIASVFVVVAAAAVAYALMKPNIYTARTSLLPPSSQQQSSSSAALAALGSLGGGLVPGGFSAKTSEELYVNLLKSDTVQRALSDRFKLQERHGIKDYETMRAAFPRFVRVSAEKKSGVITVEVDDEDPAFAAQLANAYSAEITKLLGRLAMSEAQQRRVFFEQQLKEVKENLIQAEQALRNVQEKSGMLVMDKQAEAIIEAVSKLKTRIAEREIRLKVMRTGTTGDNPDVKLLSYELQALRSELARMESSASGAEGGKIDIPVGKLPAAAVDYLRAMREMKFQESMLASMLRQFEIAKLDEAKEAPSLQQVDAAVAPDRKSKPARAVIVLSWSLAALVLSSAWVVWRRWAEKLRKEADPAQSEAWAKLSAAWRLRRSS